MLQYCRSDVDILRRGCLEFRNLMIKATTIKKSTVRADGITKTTVTSGVDPFDFVTIASVCMGIFKCLFLKEKHEIEIIKDGESTWYNVECPNGIDGVNINESWTSLVDLKKDESVQIGKDIFRVR